MERTSLYEMFMKDLGNTCLM